MILGLQLALEKDNRLVSYPRLNVTISSDSKYVVKSMNEWIYKWSSNRWTNARGEEVVNRDLLEEASGLDDRLRKLGRVTYMWMPRTKNKLADRYCTEELDKIECEAY